MQKRGLKELRRARADRGEYCPLHFKRGDTDQAHTPRRLGRAYGVIKGKSPGHVPCGFLFKSRPPQITLRHDGRNASSSPSGGICISQQAFDHHPHAGLRSFSFAKNPPPPPKHPAWPLLTPCHVTKLFVSVKVSDSLGFVMARKTTSLLGRALRRRPPRALFECRGHFAKLVNEYGMGSRPLR